MNRKRILRSWWLWGLVVLFVIFVLPGLLSTSGSYHGVSTSDAITQIQNGNVQSAIQSDKEQSLQLTLKKPFDGNAKISTQYPANYSNTITNDLHNAKVQFKTHVSKQNTWLSLLVSLLPILLIVGVLFFVMSQVQGGGNRVMSFGRSKAKLVNKDTPKTTFQDVAGADEAIEELQEIKDFLSNPARFQAIGAKIPKGVLLYGPPGTGKTLLARAVAGEAGVPFYSISGSDFVEMFVGVGASRVRDLFEQAKANAPAIIFVDEIDAVGRHRGAGLGGGHDEREQTLNQLLVEMDGFDVKGGVILIAATNRPDILDPALLRPGRFDRQIAVGPPDVIGREAVLKVHAKGKPFAADVDLSVIARRTPGFTGADLANVINEAALLTARNNGRLITMQALEESIDRVIAGPERKTRAMSDKEKRVTAYHESGHALAAWAMPNLDPVHKVTILPRGRSLGHTLVLPLEDRYTQTRAEILDQLVYALGGRAAEELVFHEPTTGASNDIEKATKLARAMVTEYGMSTKLGAVKYGTAESEPFLGRDYGHTRDYSEDIAADIDAEVRDLIEGAHDEAWEILQQYRDVLDAMVLELVEKETLAKDDLERILAPVRKRPPHNTFTAFGKRTPSDRPPIDIPPSLRKPSPNGSPNGARVGSGEDDGRAQPGVLPEPTMPQPPTPGPGQV
jgi:cell division protease FtsH